MTTPSAQPPAELSPAQREIDALLIQVNEQIETLTFDADNQAILQRLVEGFSDSRGMTRLRIAETLGEIGEPATFVLTEAMLQHDDPVVRRACAKTLTLIADPRAVPALMTAFLNDEDTVVQGSAAGAMARTGREAAPELLRILDSDYSESIKGHAAWALAFMGAEVKDLLYQALNSESEQVRAAVIGAIAKVAQEEPQADHCERLIQALEDDSQLVRSEAAATLGNLAYQPAVSALVKLLSSEQAADRKAAALSLMKIRDAAAIAPLQTTLANEPDDGLKPVLQLAISQLEKRSAAADDWE
ncbi:MAG: HEAT repeat domain-containing protein [Leptolyngbya sp. SIO4C1]|nr:HEAT repeat domain-containing protein [Leptolyngbya sp. SIO4C1]